MQAKLLIRLLYRVHRRKSRLQWLCTTSKIEQPKLRTYQTVLPRCRSWLPLKRLQRKERKLCVGYQTLLLLLPLRQRLQTVTQLPADLLLVCLCLSNAETLDRLRQVVIAQRLVLLASHGAVRVLRDVAIEAFIMKEGRVD